MVGDASAQRQLTTWKQLLPQNREIQLEIRANTRYSNAYCVFEAVESSIAQFPALASNRDVIIWIHSHLPESESPNRIFEGCTASRIVAQVRDRPCFQMTAVPDIDT